MEKILKITDKELGLYENFLDSIPFKSDIFPKCWEITKLEEGKYRFWISFSLEQFLKHFDHDCKASPEDGCSFCGMLLDLGLIADYDREEEYMQEKADEVRDYLRESGLMEGGDK